jgi:short subunit fatty acids transporter
MKIINKTKTIFSKVNIIVTTIVVIAVIVIAGLMAGCHREVKECDICQGEPVELVEMEEMDFYKTVRLKSGGYEDGEAPMSTTYIHSGNNADIRFYAAKGQVFEVRFVTVNLTSLGTLRICLKDGGPTSFTLDHTINHASTPPPPSLYFSASGGTVWFNVAISPGYAPANVLVFFR